ncbi:hypothetical protein DM01DRAFT_1315741 [Hesseltinella vesiculosa]|uniref:Uncharacterized protein n=1 Tax=Hesseltinella vesiculosa TaxID=101127 RepID=A0A1X2GW87_9FUNG|nr:hypothetical protein DM01DRAFT_1315741 [Hesseltinella vesiculosa]
MKTFQVILALGALLVATAQVEAGCSPSGCVCNGIQGQFCGDESINSACTNGHVFECQSGTGYACDYGVRDSCVQCGALSC